MFRFISFFVQNCLGIVLGCGTSPIGFAIEFCAFCTIRCPRSSIFNIFVLLLSCFCFLCYSGEELSVTVAALPPAGRLFEKYCFGSKSYIRWFSFRPEIVEEGMLNTFFHDFGPK